MGDWKKHIMAEQQIALALFCFSRCISFSASPRWLAEKQIEDLEAAEENKWNWRRLKKAVASEKAERKCHWKSPPPCVLGQVSGALMDPRPEAPRPLGPRGESPRVLGQGPKPKSM